MKRILKMMAWYVVIVVLLVTAYFGLYGSFKMFQHFVGGN